MKILVTGANGFLGLNVLLHIAEAHPDAEITAVDLAASLTATDDRIKYRYLDVRDRSACLEFMHAVNPTHVIHAAAVTLTDESAASTKSTAEVNFGGTQNILRAATSVVSVKRLLTVSSSGVYAQNSNDVACDELHPLDLSNNYACTKWDAEMLMADFEEIGGFPIIAARVGPVYGDFELSRATRPKVSTIQQLTNFLIEQRTVRISGTDSHRDWTHARDIARALDGLLCAPVLNHRTYNVSAGVSVSARSMIDIFVEHGLRVEWVDDPDAADLFLAPQQGRKALVIRRLQQDTGFMPRFDMKSGIDQLIETSIQNLKDIR